MAEQALKDQTEIVTCIARAPGIVFLLVAAADGKIDNKEIKQFAKLLKSPDYEILVAAMQQAGQSLLDLLTDVQNSQLQPLEELKQLREILDNYFPEDAALLYKSTLLKLAIGTAQASGGLFGIFGNKIGKEEEIVLAMIVSVLGLLEDTSQQTDVSSNSEDLSSQLDYHSMDDLPDHLYPVLKPADWAENAKDDVVIRGIYAENDIRANEPVVGYALDLPETIQFLSKDSVSENLSIEDIHSKALHNLDQRLLAGTKWQELNYQLPDEPELEVSGLVLTGDYYSSEALLSNVLLKIAHRKLDAEMLMVIAPERGKLFATKIISEGDNPEPDRLMFASMAVANYFNPEQAPISPNVWIVRNEKLVGQIQGMDAVLEGAKKHAENTIEENDKKLTHSANIFEEANGIGVKVAVVAHDMDVMLTNLQHVIRGYVQQAIQQKTFNGSMRVSVDIQDPSYAPEMKNYLTDQLGDMSEFLSNQFVSLGMVCADKTHVKLSCTVESH